MKLLFNFFLLFLVCSANSQNYKIIYSFEYLTDLEDIKNGMVKEYYSSYFKDNYKNTYGVLYVTNQ
ncbi:hypothetical protein K5I29_09815 [Flavobacterium agricola]|uniref:GLPGLI family protein n=1 Tax=Flavobacterium agricola TaxID=2870839 RepID=A0ABY6LWT1_9FLAO|nr:hypothetical protein [Flavobacterium agricola]UYW00798.1 hypothetical protein K5I29_09815 [Flavobacterium agricola]